jgi:hypothetical protein
MNIADFLAAAAVSLGLTIAFELGFFFLSGKRNKKDLFLLVLVNVLTNPAVMLLYWLSVFFTNWNSTIVKVPLEILAVFIEGYYYKKYGQDFKHPYRFSAAANMFSFGIGVLIQHII